MKKLTKKQAVIGVEPLEVVIFNAAAIFAYTSQLNDNLWKHALFAGGTKGKIIADNKELIVNGNIRSNESIHINSESVQFDGYAAAVSSVTGIPRENIFENAEAAAFPDVYKNVYDIAEEYEATVASYSSYVKSSLVLDDKAISSSELNIDVNAEYSQIFDNTASITGKMVAFDANFFTKTYSNLDKKFSEYMSELKSDNPITEICSEGSITIQANNSVNPKEAESVKKIIVEGGHFSLNGEYNNLEEIKFNSWGGSQLIGNYPNLKYIYKTSGSDLNLVGDFPNLECIYMQGGQLLIGSGDGGFNANGVKIINDYGSIAIYTAKDVILTNSEIATTQMITIRGNGSDKLESVFNTENTIMAAQSGIMFEDMNNSNIRRFDKLPVYYSIYPISVNNCSFKLFQGTLINNNAIIMSNANISKFRGYIFSPEWIDEYKNYSAVCFYINTYAYNISPNINNLNKQPNGSERTGRISEFEYTKFPNELSDKILDSDKFLADFQNKGTELEIGESSEKLGELAIGRYILANGDINISADTMVNRENSIAVIATKSGNITINVTDIANITAVIYAPCGKVTINGNEYEIKGRIFAENIEINASSFKITGDEDISYLGFVYDKKVDDVLSEPESSTESTSEESSEPEESSSESGGSELGFDNPQYEYDLLNRLVKITYDKDSYIEYIYDADGNIIKIVTVIDGDEQ